jgi:hypothetical protein
MTMTSPLPAAPIPALDAGLLAARRTHLIREINDEASRGQGRRRWTVTAAAALAAGVTVVIALITGVAGPASAPAIAGWTAEPTGVPGAQQTAVRANCLAAMLTRSTAKTAASRPWQLVLAEQRGPTRFSILASGPIVRPVCSWPAPARRSLTGPRSAPANLQSTRPPSTDSHTRNGQEQDSPSSKERSAPPSLPYG